MEYMIKENFGDYCLDVNDGKRFYYVLRGALQAKHMTEIDFQGVRVVTSIFLEEAFYHIAKNNNPNAIFAKIKFRHVNESLRNTILFTIDHLRKYHKDLKYKEIIDSLFGERNSKAEQEVKRVASKKRSRKRSKTKRTTKITLPEINDLDVRSIP